MPKTKKEKTTVEMQTTLQNEFVEGTLETYFETGMEQLGLILYKDGHLFPNPKYDPTKKGYPYDIPHFKDWSGIIFLEGKGEKLEILDSAGNVKETLFLIKDRKAMAEDGYKVSLIPVGFTKHDWLAYFIGENVKARLYLRDK